jgi:threonine aldolase
VALRTGIRRLSEDHENARAFAEAVAVVDGLFVDLESVQSNIINLDVGGLGIDAGTFSAHLAEQRVRGLPGLGKVVRFVTYRGITREDIDEAVGAVRGVVAARPWEMAPV